MNKKFFGKFNWVDVMIAVAVIAAIAIVGYKFLKPAASVNVNNAQKVEMTFFVEETPDYAASIIKEGDRVYDEARNCVLGNVKTLEINDSVFYGINSNGEIIRGSKPGYKSVKITTEIDAELYENGVSVGVTKYGVGHTFTFYAGRAKLYGKVAGINGGK